MLIVKSSYFSLLLKWAAILIWTPIAVLFGFVLYAVTLGSLETWGRFLRFFSKGVLKILGIQIEVVGQEHIQKGAAIYVANHQSGLDLVAFGALPIPRMIAIGKKEMLFIPFLGFFFWLTRNVLIDRQNKAKAKRSLDQAFERIKYDGASIGFFPEGTRNRSPEPLLPFKRGAFALAIRAQVPIVPIVCSSQKDVLCSLNFLSSKSKGPTPQDSNRRLKIVFLAPVSVAGMQSHSAEQIVTLCESVRSKMLDVLSSLR